VSFAHVSRGGTYYRVADPQWRDPLDGRRGVAKGGRWNAPESFPVVYLNQTRALARKFVAHKLRDQPYGPEDLDPGGGPTLTTVDLETEDHVDVVTDIGCIAAGLPSSYPRDAAGQTIPHEVCRPIGRTAWDAGEPGVACRSATTTAETTDEELAWFQRTDPPTAVAIEPFVNWFFTAS